MPLGISHPEGVPATRPNPVIIAAAPCGGFLQPQKGVSPPCLSETPIPQINLPAGTLE